MPRRRPLLIGGGIGITPMLAGWRDTLFQAPRVNLSLIHGHSGAAATSEMAFCTSWRIALQATVSNHLQCISGGKREKNPPLTEVLAPQTAPPLQSRLRPAAR